MTTLCLRRATALLLVTVMIAYARADCNLASDYCYKVIQCPGLPVGECTQLEQDYWLKVITVYTKYQCYAPPEAESGEECDVNDDMKTNLCSAAFYFSSQAHCEGNINPGSANLYTGSLCAGSDPCDD